MKETLLGKVLLFGSIGLVGLGILAKENAHNEMINKIVSQAPIVKAPAPYRIWDYYEGEKDSNGFQIGVWDAYLEMVKELNQHIRFIGGSGIPAKADSMYFPDLNRDEKVAYKKR